jgi:rRNA maturation RNase YbeY
MTELNVLFEDCEPFDFNSNTLLDAYELLCYRNGKSLGALSVVFCSNDYVQDINRSFLEHDYPTDIITFDYCEGKHVVGDLLIGLDVVRENSDLYKTQLHNELFRVCLHGVLHLVGFGDKSEEQAAVMREQEELYLKTCPNPFDNCFT